MARPPPKRVQFLGAEQIAQAVEELAILARDEGVHIALLGGVAMQVYGSDRLTKDIDIMAEQRIKALPVGKHLSFGGEQTRAPNGVTVDIIRRTDDAGPLYDAALNGAVRVKGVPIAVVRPEYLAAIKMEASRPRDELDLAFLVASEVADLGKTRKIIKKFMGFYAANEFDAFVAEVAWRKAAGKL